MSNSLTGATDNAPAERASALAAWLLLAGATAVLLGAIVLLWPGATAFALAWLIGAHLILASVTLIAPARHSMGRQRPARIAVGTLVALAGVSTLMWPDATVRTLAVLFGAAGVVAGVGTISSGLSLRSWLPTSEWPVVAGILGVVAGLTAFVWPDVTVGVLTTMVGLYLVAYGTALGVAGWQVRGQAKWLRECVQVRTAVHHLDIRIDRNTDLYRDLRVGGPDMADTARRDRPRRLSTHLKTEARDTQVTERLS